MNDFTIPTEWRERLRAFDAFDDRVAEDALPIVDAHLRATARAKTNAYGVPWAPSKSGAPVLQRAANRDVLVITRGLGKLGHLILCRVVGNSARHDLGVANHSPRRAILPDVAAPPLLAAKLRASAVATAQRLGAQ